MKCNLCDREFKTEEALKQHKSNRHSVEHGKGSGSKSSRKIWIWLGLIFIVFGLFYISGGDEEVSTRYDEFAQCLDDAGIEMYGAWWCHNCEAQLDMFERSDKVPYNECSTSSRAQIASCNNLGIKSYPTWIFDDGSRVEGVQSFATLADKTGCALPA
jgi:hypothetical protein